MTETINIQGFEELLKALETLPEKARPLAEDAMQKSLMLLQDQLAAYPPVTEANRPGRYSLATGKPMGYYERGRGWWYPIMRRRTLGTQLGKRTGSILRPKSVIGSNQVAGYKLRQTSERLGTKWARRVIVDSTGVIGELGTTVSYADYVQGSRQSAVHAGIGWETAADVLVDNTDEIIGFFEQAADQLIQEF